jgi:hypothetical protein
MNARKKSRIETWAPIAIAMMSLGLAINEGVRSREHDRLSVKPVLGVDVSGGSSGWKMSVTNKGLGPGSIASFKVFRDGKSVINSDGLLEGVIDRPSYLVSVASMNPQRAFVLPGTVADIVKIDWPDLAKPPANSLAEMLQQLSGRLRFVMCYCSMYGECWSLEAPVGSPEFMNLAAGCTHQEGFEFNEQVVGPMKPVPTK